jgi:uncharacterized protein (DUF924 family)
MSAPDFRVVLHFWFEETEPKQRWSRSEAFDRSIAERFGQLHAQAAQGELFEWRSSPQGRLAEILVLDQFSRHLCRDQAAAFAQDPTALALAQTAVDAGADALLEPVRRAYLYMPYMHSESARIHDEAVRLFTALGVADSLRFELRHQAVIDRFGRYPHRNAALGRVSTPEELEFLETPGSSF